MKRRILVLVFAAGVFATAVSFFVVPEDAARSDRARETPTAHSPSPGDSQRAEVLVERHFAGISASNEAAARDFARRLKAEIGGAVYPGEEGDFWALNLDKDWVEDREGAYFLGRFKKFAVERPEAFENAVQLVGRQANAGIASLVDSLESLAHEVRDVQSFVRPLDILGIPRTRGLRREAFNRSWDPLFPASPWIDGVDVTGAWDLGGEERGDWLLVDDGSIRTGTQGLWLLKFREEGPRFVSWSWGQVCSVDLLWKLALFARWGLEQGEFEVAIDCLLRAREIGAHRWPGDDDAALGTRAAREGIKNLADSPASRQRFHESIAAALLAGPGPLRDHGTPRPAPDLSVLREVAINDGMARWEMRDPDRVLVLPLREQAEAALWRALSWRSKEIEDDRISSFLCSVADGKPSSYQPVEWLRSLGWDAVPTLVAHLDDPLATASCHLDYTVRVGDVCWLALRAFTGLPDPPEFDATRPWLLATPGSRTFILEIRSWWSRASVLGEAARWQQLFRQRSAPAAAWLLSHDPQLCLPEAWEQLDPATRRGRIGRLAIEQSLTAAPREKLESLLQQSAGEVRDAVGRAIEAQLARERR